MIRTFAGFDTATVGLLGQQLISVSTIDALREAYPNMRFVDASNLVDRIRVVKHDEERELLRLTGQQQDAAVAAVFDEIKPGMKERDVLIRAQEIVSTSGSTQGLYVVGSGNADVLATPKPFGQQHQVLEDGDMLPTSSSHHRGFQQNYGSPRMPGVGRFPTNADSGDFSVSPS